MPASSCVVFGMTRRGDEVEWNTLSGGRRTATPKKLTADTKIKSHEQGLNDDPQFVAKSDPDRYTILLGHAAAAPEPSGPGTYIEQTLAPRRVRTKNPKPQRVRGSLGPSGAIAARSNRGSGEGSVNGQLVGTTPTTKAEERKTPICRYASDRTRTGDLRRDRPAF